jgi:DNA-binding response OmpR family regulator
MGGLAADDYIVKPFNIEDLKARINKILNKA